VSESANYMTCEKLRAWMPIQTCLGRQTKGIGNWEAGPRLIPYECRDCVQGANILAIVRNPENAANTTKEPKGKEEIEMARMPRTLGCSNCKRDKLVVGGGLCAVCYRVAAGKAGPTRDAALVEAKRKIDAGEIQTRGTKRTLPAAKREEPANLQTCQPEKPNFSPGGLVGEYIPGKVENFVPGASLSARSGRRPRSSPSRCGWRSRSPSR